MSKKSHQPSPLLALPCELRVLIWEYLCTVPIFIQISNPRNSWEYLCGCPTPSLIDVNNTKHRNCAPTSFIAKPYNPVRRVLNIARTCRDINFELMPLFYARNTFYLPSPLIECDRWAAAFPTPALHPRAAHITHFSTTVAECPPAYSQEEEWRGICDTAHMLEKAYPALVEYRINIEMEEHCWYFGRPLGRWILDTRTQYRGGWHNLLARTEEEGRLERVKIMRRWFRLMEESMDFDAATRTMKVVFRGCCGLLDTETFQIALVGYLDECDERNGQKDMPLLSGIPDAQSGDS